MFSADWTEAKTLSQPHSCIGLKSGASCKYLKSISRVFHKPVFIGLNCRCGLHLRLKELLHYCCLSLAASMGTTIELSEQLQNTRPHHLHRSGIGCHNNFVKAEDNFSCVRGRFWNMMLTMFYLNVFSLPTLKDVVGHYKLWNEVMFWLNTNCVLQCFNTFHCL